MTANEWERYAFTRIDASTLADEPVQLMRLQQVAQRCVGSVLDVGGADGYGTKLIEDAGHPVTLLEIAEKRITRARANGVQARQGDAMALPYDDDSFDTVVLGEILEHLDNPGLALSEAHRVARERVIVSVPLNGWEDPTHRWRISLDFCEDPFQHEREPTKGQQVIVTWQRGPCWPPEYWQTDEVWQSQFKEHR